jgi:hypothetical protein
MIEIAGFMQRTKSNENNAKSAKGMFYQIIATDYTNFTD